MRFVLLAVIVAVCLAESDTDWSDVIKTMGNEGVKVQENAINAENAAKDHAAALKQRAALHQAVLKKHKSKLNKIQAQEAKNMGKLNKLKHKMADLAKKAARVNAHVAAEQVAVVKAKAKQHQAIVHVKEVKKAVKKSVMNVKNKEVAQDVAIRDLHAMKKKEAKKAIHAIHKKHTLKKVLKIKKKLEKKAHKQRKEINKQRKEIKKGVQKNLKIQKEAEERKKNSATTHGIQFTVLLASFFCLLL